MIGKVIRLSVDERRGPYPIDVRERLRVLRVRPRIGQTSVWPPK